MTNYTVTQMYPTTYRKKNWGSEETTKKCVSFPQHEENLIDDWKILRQDGLCFRISICEKTH